jgi:hypothetical protein
MSVPWVALTFATVLLLGTIAGARLEPDRPLWLRVAIRLVIFGVMTWLLQRSVGLPGVSAPLLPPGMQVWAQFVEIGWWVLGARAAVGILSASCG